MTNILARWAGFGAFGTGILLVAIATAAQTQSTLVPPACVGKTGAQLDQCVRDLTAPTGAEVFVPIERKPNSGALLNCNMAYHADQGFCIARNEIVLECRKTAKHPDFQACANNLIERPQLPRVADCAREVPKLRTPCAKRNKIYTECLKNPWNYFICLGEKISAK